MDQENYEITSVFLFIAGRIRVRGMIGWHIPLFSLFKSLHKMDKGLSHSSDNLVGLLLLLFAKIPTMYEAL